MNQKLFILILLAIISLTVAIILYKDVGYKAIILKTNISTLKNNDKITQFNKLHRNEPTSTLKSTENKIVFKILYWTTSHNGPGWSGVGNVLFENCAYTNCITTSDASEYNASDAILFHTAFIRDLPQYRFPWQKWIMHNYESPNFESKRNYRRYNSKFNATWTYHHNAEIWSNYSHFSNGGLFVRKNQTFTNHTRPAHRKTKLVAWVVSQCNPAVVTSGRINYVKNLQKHIQVDVYGKCGTLKCGTRKSYQDNKCMQTLGEDYKFYLSFENSLCEEYVTEKIWRPLHNNLVPVVLGAYNYSQLLPEKSYIDVKDFASPKELAEYLTHLDRHDDLYKEYFQWKDKFEIKPHPAKECNLCEYLNHSKNETKIYDRLDLFWNRKTDCYSPSEFYKSVTPDSWKSIN